MRLTALVALVPFVACVRPPGNLAGEFTPVTVREAQQQPREGVPVRWGGKLASLRPEKDQTCFEIIGFPLDGKARPVPSDESAGRFIACAPGFYEPAVYSPGRDVTVVGVLHGTTVRKVGQYDYTFPRVDATRVYLWPEQSAEPRGRWLPSIGISVGGVFWR